MDGLQLLAALRADVRTMRMPVLLSARAGVGLLIEIAEHAEVHHAQLQMQLAPHSLVARFLTITGVEHILPVATEQSAPEH